MKKVLFSAMMMTLFTAGTVSATTENAEKIEKTRSKTFICENETKWETIGDGITRQILGYNGHIMMVKIKAEKAGPVGVEHAHYHPQVTYVSSGKFEFTIGNEKKVVTAGDGMYMEPDVRHSCICIEPGIIVDCFSPMREDFLKK